MAIQIETFQSVQDQLGQKGLHANEITCLEKKWENFMARCGDDLRTMRHEMLDDVWANTMMMHARSLQRELMSIQPLLIEIFSAKFLCCFRKQNYIYLQELNLLFELEKELYIWSTSRNNHEKLLQICC